MLVRVTSTKFLGVMIDDKLNWKLHIAEICKKMARGLGALLRVRNLLSVDTLKLLYL